jgi:hypothetical protein
MLPLTIRENYDGEVEPFLGVCLGILYTFLGMNIADFHNWGNWSVF